MTPDIQIKMAGVSHLESIKMNTTQLFWIFSQWTLFLN